jgi:hypothetical protein
MDRSVWVAMTIGSTIGSFIPFLWGGGMLSTLFWGSAGAFAGVWFNYKMSR